MGGGRREGERGGRRGRRERRREERGHALHVHTMCLNSQVNSLL